MDREQAKGTLDRGMGTAKEAASRVAGDEQAETGGKNEQLEGQTHKRAGDLREADGNGAGRARGGAQRVSGVLHDQSDLYHAQGKNRPI